MFYSELIIGTGYFVVPFYVFTLVFTDPSVRDTLMKLHVENCISV
jgi:hypothetical protein